MYLGNWFIQTKLKWKVPFRWQCASPEITNQNHLNKATDKHLRKLPLPLEEARPVSRLHPHQRSPLSPCLLWGHFMVSCSSLSQKKEQNAACPPHAVMISLQWRKAGFILIGLLNFFPGTLKFMNGKDQCDSETGLLPNINLSCHMLM